MGRQSPTGARPSKGCEQAGHRSHEGKELKPVPAVVGIGRYEGESSVGGIGVVLEIRLYSLLRADRPCGIGIGSETRAQGPLSPLQSL